MTLDFRTCASQINQLFTEGTKFGLQVVKSPSVDQVSVVSRKAHLKRTYVLTILTESVVMEGLMKFRFVGRDSREVFECDQIDSGCCET